MEEKKPLCVLGQCDILIETQSKIQCHKFHVVKGNSGSLLGYTTAEELGLVIICNNIKDPSAKYPNLFKGIGKLKDTMVKIHIDETVQPVAQKCRRTPFHLRDKVEKEIQKLLDEDIIEKVGGEPTPWVSPIVTPPKKEPGAIRICVDMRAANKAVLRERHQMPTVDELITDLNGSTVFSKLDLTAGYHQLELHPSSRYITTFSTHLGLFRYKRLNFGISSASEIFQETIRNVIQGIPGSKNISDDIIVFGKTQEEHDKALDATFKQLNDKGLTLNKKKCLFNQDKIEFFGLTFSAKGVSPDPKKIEAIANVERPENVSALKSFLGMTNYCARFIKNYATITEPLRRLLKQDTPWAWSDDQETAFQKLKESLTADPVIKYFDPKKDIEVITDASPVGLGAILVQNENVVAYASRGLTDVETRYSQTEREALAIVWACEHFDMYINGAKHFMITTDHKPLENIWKKARPPLRIERWGLRLQPYKFTIKYRPGEENPSDYFSRHPLDKGSARPSRGQKIAEQYVNFIADTSTPKSISLEDVKKATAEDKTIQKVMYMVRTGRLYEIKTCKDQDVNQQELHLFQSVREELTCHSDGILLRNDLIVMPSKLRDQAISIAHEGHQGINRTKAFIRSKVWFPGISEKIENAVKSCLACQAATYANTTYMEPLKMSDMPDRPWEKLSADFCGPLPTGEYLFVITDEYSRYPIVEITKSTSADAAIPILDKVISQFGIPKVIKTDNGTPFNSHAFANFARHMGFTHRKVTPKWPRANAQAESFNKPLMKAIRAANVEGKSWKQELYKFLRQYRSTPHSSTKLTPYQLMFARSPRTKLPEINKKQKLQDATNQQAKKNDQEAKHKMKEYADKRNHAVRRNLNVGDSVLVKKEGKGNKLSTPFEPEPYVITSKKDSMVTAKSSKKSITRNASFFKILPNTKLHGREEKATSEEAIKEPKTRGSRNPKPSTRNAVVAEQPRRSERIRRPPHPRVS